MTHGALNWFWTKVRDVARIAADARLNDLCHSDASHVAVNGESLPSRNAYSETGGPSGQAATFISTMLH